MKTRPLFLLAFLFTLARAAFGAPFERDGIALEVPQEFQGPIVQPLAAEARSFAFSRRHSAGAKATLLQVSTYDFGARMPAFAPEQSGAVAENYLRDFLRGVERRRQSFSASPATRLTLGGIPAARIAWQGLAEGERMRGVMYGVVRGSRVVMLHAQDFDSAPPDYLKQAVQAIETMRFAPGD